MKTLSQILRLLVLTSLIATARAQVTNKLGAGVFTDASTNAAQRFYRARLAP